MDTFKEESMTWQTEFDELVQYDDDGNHLAPFMNYNDELPTNTPEEVVAAQVDKDHGCNHDDGYFCTHRVGVIKAFIQDLLDRKAKVTGETSDGYHTFNELYDFRKLYNAALFNEWANQGKYHVHKSTRHHDGEACFGGGWFIVMATLPAGQISNHYELKDWDLFNIPERDRADKWDGHTAKDVIKRLKAISILKEE